MAEPPTSAPPTSAPPSSGPPTAGRSSPEVPWPVRTVARKLGDWIGRLGEVWVEGQVTQLSDRPGAATCFLVLRDPSADMSLQVTCRRDALPPALRDGTRVVVRARPDFYVARGSLSLRATEIRPVGIGELLARLERLKALLSAEGLFDPGRKRALPFLPATVGLITGRASAAERDVVDTATRRWPGVAFQIENCAVQGPTAAASVIQALRRLDADRAVEVIVIARGGGSVEDLLPFSDEALCRAVAGCRAPVVSAIGHEPDAPLLDFIADLRASTPTDAGKRVVPDVVEESARIAALRARVRRTGSERITAEGHWLATIRSRPVLADPLAMLTARAVEVAALRDRLRQHLDHRLGNETSAVEHIRARVAALSPAATLHRGYAIVQRDSGEVLRAAADVRTGEQLSIRLAVGRISATAGAGTVSR